MCVPQVKMNAMSRQIRASLVCLVDEKMVIVSTIQGRVVGIVKGPGLDVVVW